MKDKPEAAFIIGGKEYDEYEILPDGKLGPMKKGKDLGLPAD